MRLSVLPISNVRDVAEARLCCGCGACAYVTPEQVEMIDVLEEGRRPQLKMPADAQSQEALAVCPGIGLPGHDRDAALAAGAIAELLPAWGPVLELWEGYAADDEIRRAASSGGAASALALFCIEQGEMHGLLHIAARADVPYLNRTVMSRTREQILSATGSRYAPASPCDRLDLIESAPAPCVFIGKPCDVAAARRAGELRPALGEKLGLTIAVFCAGTPSTQGTLEMLREMGFDEPAAAHRVRYRGNGWPGDATASGRVAGRPASARLTYEQSWGRILQRHRQWRCHVCADHTGEFADIAVGDPWYRRIEPGEPGQSLVLARTERGRRILREAVEAGYLKLERVEPSILPASQPNLLRTRGAVWGRIWALRLSGIPAPRFHRMPMARIWWRELSLRQKLQSIAGTIRRILRKRLWKRAPLKPYQPRPGSFDTTDLWSDPIEQPLAPPPHTALAEARA